MGVSKQLTEKYARLMGHRMVLREDVTVLEAVRKRLERAQTEIEKLDADLSAVAQTALLFDPTFSPSTIKPIRPHKRSHPVAASSYIRAALRVLRASDRSLTAAEIADGVHDVLGLPDRTAWKQIRANLQGGLQRYADRGYVTVERVKPLRYSLNRQSV